MTHFHSDGRRHRPAPNQLRGRTGRLLEPGLGPGDVVNVEVGGDPHRYRVEASTHPDVVVLNHWPREDCCGCHAWLEWKPGTLNIDIG